MHAVGFGISGVRRGGKEVVCSGFVLLMMKGWKEEKAQEVIVLPFRLRKKEPPASIVTIKQGKTLRKIWG